MHRLSERVDEYVSKLLARTDAPMELRANALSAFAPTEPDYTNPLVDLIQRLASSAWHAAKLPRQLDLVLFERLVRRRNLDLSVVDRLELGSRGERLIRLVAAFLRGQVNLPDVVDKVLVTPIRDNKQQSEQLALPENS
jgi:hypothetical protein